MAKSRSRCSLPLLTTVFLLLAAGIASAQAAKKQPPRRLEARTIGVTISRQDGASPSALTQQNFRVMEDGVPQTITSFTQSGRNQYTISYKPANRTQDGSYRKIKVELVDGNGQPLKMRNEKGKEVKYQIIAREGYKAGQELE
jgi:hypothetical protein